MSGKKIDVHTHVVPPFWSEAVDAAGRIPSPPQWDEEQHLKVMDRCNISKSILSIPSPGSNFVRGDNDAGRHLARRCNHFAADIKKRNPDRFGYWATLPLPDVEGSVAEIAHAFDNLDADGVGILTNHDGVYIGDPSLDPVFAALNQRKATVFIHPTIPCMAHGGELVAAIPLKGFPPGMFEYFFEEVRVILNLLSSKTVTRYPDVKFIIPHAGGAFPPVIERFASFGTWIFGNKEELSSDMIKQIMGQQFFFDLTGFVFPDQIHGLLRFVDSSRLFFGSDYPYIREDSMIKLSDKMDHDLPGVIKDEADREAIYHGNMEKLLSDMKVQRAASS